MTPEQINIAIAEWMGWNDIHMCRIDCELGEEPIGIPPGKLKPGVDGTQYHPIPNFHGDLNACHKALLHMTPEELALFSDCLIEETDALISSDRLHPSGVAALIKSTSQQVSKCIVKAIGKWKE